MNDILLAKKEIIERCIKQIREYYKLTDPVDIIENHMIQDAIAINLQRACEACIDMANHYIRINRLGIPKTSSESFIILFNNKIIPKKISDNLIKMTGFRNILIHEYQKINMKIFISIIEEHLEELVDYTTYLINA